MIGKQHYYLQDVQRASYFIDRALRGKFEIQTSHIRELSFIQYKKKVEIRNELNEHNMTDDVILVLKQKIFKYDKIKSLIENAAQKVHKIQ